MSSNGGGDWGGMPPPPSRSARGISYSWNNSGHSNGNMMQPPPPGHPNRHPRPHGYGNHSWRRHDDDGRPNHHHNQMKRPPPNGHHQNQKRARFSYRDNKDSSDRTAPHGQKWRNSSNPTMGPPPHARVYPKQEDSGRGIRDSSDRTAPHSQNKQQWQNSNNGNPTMGLPPHARARVQEGSDRFNRNPSDRTSQSQWQNRSNGHPTMGPPLRARVHPKQEDPPPSSTHNHQSSDRKPVGTEPPHRQEVAVLSNDSDDPFRTHEETPPDNKTNESTHIIFCIDFSGSMRDKDVKNKTGYISRWDAVFECIKTFLEDQVEQQKQNNNQKQNSDDDLVTDDDDDDEVMVLDTAMVSVVIFSDKAKTLLERMPLVGDGRKVQKALETARKLNKPRGGTFFAAGLEQVKQIASNHNKTQGNVVLVFLSDGRPADLSAIPPNPEKPMQTTFRRNRKKYPAAGQHIQAVKEQYGDRFSFHLICIYNQGKKWLKYLADRYDGTFHEPDLSMDDDEPVQQTQQIQPQKANSGIENGSDDDDEPVQQIQPQNTNSGIESGSDDDDELVQQFQQIQAQNSNIGIENGSDDDDEIVEMVVKSQATLIRERHNRALAAGAVYSLADTTTAVGSSMRSTFQSISLSVTAMRHGSSRLRERKGVVIKDNSPMIPYAATRMVLDAEHAKITVPVGEKPNGREVTLSMHPFAQGGLRNVYRMRQSGFYCQVAKESRHNIPYQERLRFHIETSKCQARAAEYAEEFNEQVKKRPQLESVGVPHIEMLQAEVYRLKDPAVPGGYRYLAVEAELKGAYEKWNSNSGYVNPSDSLQCKVAQAFSHYSYEHSKQKEMVVDIQGSFDADSSCCKYTDPQLHSLEKEFGRADRGASGCHEFFKSHKCNFICKELHLADRSTANSDGSVTVKQEKT